ncbi:MAG: hypothetical protein ACR2QK_22560, partial [Acidimicrobiales bacterium]
MPFGLAGLRVGLAVTAGVTLAVALLALDARATYGARVTADEPQYLLTAISLGDDLDLDISDELAEQRFRGFHGVDLDPQTIALDRAGRRVSPHDPLLPALLAVPMAIGGWALAKATMAVIAATTAAATVWLAVRRFAVSVPTAVVVTTALFCTPPLVAYGNQIYPEMPAALAVVIGVGVVTGRPTVRSQWPAMVAVIALPWLAVKYTPVALVIAIALLAPILLAPILGRADEPNHRDTRRKNRRRALVPIVILAGAAVSYLAAHRWLYGGWTVYAAGDHFV